MTTQHQVRWQVRRELDLPAVEHRDLAGLLARCFPKAVAYRDTHSWHSARPELRVVGYAGERAVAHAGLLRRFVRAGGTDVLVGDVGLVGVDPDRQGTGLGRALLDRARDTLAGLEVAFGLLTTSADLVAFYRSGGWIRVGDRTRMLAADGAPKDWRGPALVLPVRAPITAWPGGLIERNGYEV